MTLRIKLSWTGSTGHGDRSEMGYPWCTGISKFDVFDVYAESLALVPYQSESVKAVAMKPGSCGGLAIYSYGACVDVCPNKALAVSWPMGSCHSSYCWKGWSDDVVAYVAG